MEKFIVLLSLVPVVMFAQNPPLVLEHVTVLDCTGAAPKADRTVIISNGHIKRMAPQADAAVTPDAQRMDASGKFLIPGLWDMHVHNTGRGFSALYIANGVTGVRDMGSPFPAINAEKKAIASGRHLGPQIIAAGTILEGGAAGPLTVAVPDAAVAHRQVLEHKQQGADFIKVGSLLSREAYFAILEEAKSQKLPVAGHMTKSVSLWEASDSGQKCVEHLDGFFVATSSRESELTEETKKTLAEADAAKKKLEKDYNKANGEAYGKLISRVLGGISVEAMASRDPQKVDALCARFIKNQTWQCPTLYVHRVLQYLGDPKLAADPRNRYVPKDLKAFWRVDPRFQDWGPKNEADVEKGFQILLDTVGKMNRSGVLLLAGTDDTNPYVLPGFSIHDELAMLVRAGLTPLEALQTATLNPAKFLGIQEELGTVEEGKRACLVMLDANPLEDIRNTAKIAAVILDGRLLKRADLDALLAEVETSVRGK